MPAIPTVDALTLGTIFARDIGYASRSLHTAGNILMRRDGDNHIAEVIGVVIGIAVIMGALLYWGVHKQGSCEWRPKKR